MYTMYIVYCVHCNFSCPWIRLVRWFVNGLTNPFQWSHSTSLVELLVFWHYCWAAKLVNFVNNLHNILHHNIAVILLECCAIFFQILHTVVCILQSNFAISNGLIRNLLVLKNHFPWPICHLLHKDKEHLALRNNFRATRKFLIAKFDCTTDFLLAEFQFLIYF